MKKNLFFSALLCVTSLSMAQVNMRYGEETEQNRRDHQEDRFAYESIKNKKRSGIFVGVYDGHSGDKTSSHLKDNLHKYFDRCLHDTSTIEGAFKCAFAQAEKHALENFGDGSTAVVGYVDSDNILHCAWAGDSRLVLEENGNVDFATEDHKPDREDEKERIEFAGGRIRKHGVWRVNGLAMSRSIGDRSLKGGGLEGRIIATPEYAKMQLTSDNNFFVIASDGLWDAMSNDSAVNLVQEKLKSTNDLNVIALSLIDEAKKRGSEDNITVSVVAFDWQKKGKSSH